MADNEAGFTFVDKRKIVDGDEAGDVAVEEAPADSSNRDRREDDASGSAFEEAGDDPSGDPAGDESPDVYMLLQYCAKLLAADAWQKMGLLADPRTGQAKADLPQAKTAIDAVGDLMARIETASDTAVPPALRRDLRNLLNDLRLNYVNQRSAVG